MSKKDPPKTFISMAPDNNHLPYLHKTIDSLYNQSHQPFKIILNIPDQNKFSIPNTLTNPKYSDKLIINKCKNFKEGNILFPLLLNKKKLNIKPNDNILTTSDKIDYPNNFIKSMLNSQSNNKNKAIINKKICKDCPSTLFKLLAVKGVDINIPQEESSPTPK